MLQYKLHHYLFLFLTLAMTLTLPQNSIGQTVPPVEKYSISPTQALAKNPFKLNLLGGNWPCQTTFSRESVLVTGKRIDLSFIVNLNVTPMPYILSNDVPVPSLSPICIMPLSNLDTIGPVYVSGPVFSVPALAVGQYEVWATQMVECLYTQPMCKIAVIPILVGTLNVTAQGAITYTINPTTTPLKKDFTLDLLSYQFNCGTTYDMLASSVTGNTIALTFLDHENPLTACPAIYKPYGPSYKMTGLPAGKYDVKVYHLPACAAQHCPFAAITPEDAGILTVTDSTQRKGISTAVFGTSMSAHLILGL